MMDERSNDVLSQKLSAKEKELAETKTRETDCKATLSNLRRTAAKLIRALNEVRRINWWTFWISTQGININFKLASMGI